MAARIPMSSPNGHGRRIHEVDERPPTYVSKAEANESNGVDHELSRLSREFNRMSNSRRTRAGARIKGAPTRTRIATRRAMRSPYRTPVAVGAALVGGEMYAAHQNYKNEQVKAERERMRAQRLKAKQAAPVAKALPMWGKPKLIPCDPPPRNTDRRSQLTGGGAAFVERKLRKHPFASAFGGTLIALSTIHGKPDRGL